MQNHPFYKEVLSPEVLVTNPTFTGQKNRFFCYLTIFKFVILSSVFQKKNIRNLKTRPSYLEKTYFQIKLINYKGVIILSTGETPGEMFAAKAHHRSYFM